jgi:hypothetical protein
VLALALLIAILAGLQGAGPLDLRSQAVRQELSAALAHYARTPVVHETGTFSHDGHVHQVDATIAKGGDSQGTVTVDGQRVEYRYTGGHAYVLAPQEYWSTEQRLAPFLAGKWVTSPGLLDELSTDALGRSLALLDLARPGVTFTRRGQRAHVGGVPAEVLSDRSGDLYVSTVGPTRFLRVVSSPSYRTADGITDVRIDLNYPAALTVQAPSPVVDVDDPSTLPAQYVVEPDSFAFASCETSSGCTVTATVRNRRGPQVGSPSAEFHLARADGGDLGRCTAPIRPAGHDQTQTVSCTVSGPAWVQFSRVGGRYLGTVTVHNPFYDG